MKYAIISDIHGNSYAFNAVLEDAKTQNVDKYLLLGDYTTNYSQGNDVMNAIRKLRPVLAVRGNNDNYIVDLRNKDRSEWVHEQLKPMYWAFQNLSPENIRLLANMPATAKISDGDFNINLASTMKLFYRLPEIELFDPRHFRALMASNPFSHDEYLLFAKAIFLSCPGVLEDVLSLPEGIYLYGHNHLQFHMEYEGRLFINPGSCGDSLNWDTRAAYTILTLNNNRWDVNERRVEYDTQLVADDMDASGFTEYNPVFSEILKMQVRSAKDFLGPFIMHVMKKGQENGETVMPVSNKTLEEAVRTWDFRRAVDARSTLAGVGY